MLAGCSDPGPTPLARPQHRSQQALGSGYAGTAQFDAPVVAPATWQGTPIGTGTWSTSGTPAASGGPSAIGFLDTQGGVTAHYLMVGNLTAGGKFFGIISEGQLLTAGTSTVNNTTLHAGLFDAATGEPVAIATSGTITLSAAGSIGGRLTGSFSGTLEDVAATGCTSDSQCGSNELCVSGTCVRQGCTSNSQCASGQVCQAGVCLSQPSCTSNSQCASGQVCQAGICVSAPPPGCEGMEGTGSYAGSVSSLAVCSALGSGPVSVSRAVAAIGRDRNGALSLYVMDPARDSAGLVFPLSGCPAGAGTLPTDAVYWDQTSSGKVTFYSARPATAGELTFLRVGSRLEGTFGVTLEGGGQLKGSFALQ